MLSDEERKAIENLKIEYEKLMKEDNILFPLYKSDAKRLIDIIEKQSKEIEELKIAFNNCFDECTSLRENFHKQIEISKNKDKKWEYKIKAKIEEYKKQIEKMKKDDVGIGFTLGKEWSDLKAKVEFGQSLLEKE